MIISKTPLRVSFFGGGSDYPSYVRKHGGMTLAAAINHFTYVTVFPLSEIMDKKLIAHYSKVERVDRLDEILHPSIRETLRYLDIQAGVETHIVADLPARSGLGSSSCFTVGFLKALLKLQKYDISNQEIAAKAVDIEQNWIKERVGAQDQYSCAIGGINLFRFQADGKVEIERIAQNRLKELSSHLMLFYTGVQRFAHEILDEQLARTSAGDLDQTIGQMKKLAEEGRDILNSRDESIEKFGYLLDEAWRLKLNCSSKIADEFTRNQYDKAIKNKALGGKLLGAGGGGFFLFFCRPEDQTQLAEALLPWIQVKFDFSSQGSEIIFATE